MQILLEVSSFHFERSLLQSLPVAKIWLGIGIPVWIPRAHFVPNLESLRIPRALILPALIEVLSNSFVPCL